MEERHADVAGRDAGLLQSSSPVAVVLTGLSFAVMAANRLTGPPIVTAFSLVAAAFAVLFGPQNHAPGPEGDLQRLDVLETWPVSSGSVLRGEILWPAGVVTLIVWVGVTCATIFSGTAFPQMSAGWRWALACSAIVAAPALVSPQFIVRNAVAVFFPAWVPTGGQQPRGVDAMGQRLIMMAGVVLSLLLFALPGALAGRYVWLALHRLLRRGRARAGLWCSRWR